MDENGNDWDDFIDGALFAINLTNVSSTTKFSCFFMFGRQPNEENEEVETPLPAAVLTKASQHGEATRPPPNRTHEQTRDTVPSLSSTGK